MAAIYDKDSFILPNGTNIYKVYRQWPRKIIPAIEEYFYSGCQKTFRYLNAFSTTTYTAIPYFRTYLWKAVGTKLISEDDDDIVKYVKRTWLQVKIIIAHCIHLILRYVYFLARYHRFWQARFLLDILKSQDDANMG